VDDATGRWKRARESEAVFGPQPVARTESARRCCRKLEAHRGHRVGEHVLGTLGGMLLARDESFLERGRVGE
jgi:hypothetical protein